MEEKRGWFAGRVEWAGSAWWQGWFAAVGRYEEDGIGEERKAQGGMGDGEGERRKGDLERKEKKKDKEKL